MGVAMPKKMTPSTASTRMLSGDILSKAANRFFQVISSGAIWGAKWGCRWARINM